MKPERIATCQREWDRLKVLHEVEHEHLTQGEAGQRLQLSDRQVHVWQLSAQAHASERREAWDTKVTTVTTISICVFQR